MIRMVSIFVSASFVLLLWISVFANYVLIWIDVWLCAAVSGWIAVGTWNGEGDGECTMASARPR